MPLIRSDRFHGGLDTHLARARTNALQDALLLNYFLEKIIKYMKKKKKYMLYFWFLRQAHLRVLLATACDFECAPGQFEHLPDQVGSEDQEPDRRGATQQFAVQRAVEGRKSGAAVFAEDQSANDVDGGR